MWFPRPKRSLRSTEYAPDVARDVRDELELHIELKTRELIEAGCSPEEARTRALQTFGDHAEITRDCETLSRSHQRKRRIRNLLESILADVRYGSRHIARRPGLAAVVLTTWAVCIGANVAIFSLVNGILLSPLPYPDADRLVAIYGSMPESGVGQLDGDVAQYLLMRDRLESVVSIALHNKVSTGIGEPGAVRNVFSMDVTTEFFDTLGVDPTLGRGFQVDDGRPGAEPVVIIRQDLADSEFGTDANPIGQRLETEPGHYTVVGVLPRDFVFADWEAELWFPLTIQQDRSFEELSRDRGYSTIARLRPRTTLSALDAELESYSSEYLERVTPVERMRAVEGGFGTHAHRLKDDQIRKVRPALLLLWGGVLLVLALGCVNIATLLLVRNTVRMRELAIRFSVGATRSRIARQLTTESVLLALLGGGLGLALGAWSLRFLKVFEAYEIPRLHDVGLDLRAIAFTLLVTTGVGLLAGLIPAVLGPFRSPQGALRNGGRGGGAQSSSTIRSVLVGTQVALAVVLLVGAALLGTSLYNAMTVDPGFETDHVLAAATVIPWDRYPSMPERNQFIEELVSRFEATPGVARAALASQLPFSGSQARDFVVPEASSADRAQVLSMRSVVSPGYFDTMGIPMRAGRGFSNDDSASVDPAVVVDEVLAQRLWPARSPTEALGRRVRIGSGDTDDGPWATVVGIAGSIVQNDPTEPSRPGAFYLPARDSGITFTRLAFKTTIEPRAAYADLRQALLRLDPQGRMFWVLSMDEAFSDQLVFRRLPTLMMLSFAAISLLLSVLGVYGVLAHAVGQRSAEIGLRMALGANPASIVTRVLRQGLLVVTVGVLAGMAIALALSRLAGGLLYDVQPNSPWIYLSVVVLVLLSTLLSGVIPTRRALRVDVVATLKGD